VCYLEFRRIDLYAFCFFIPRKISPNCNSTCYHQSMIHFVITQTCTPNTQLPLIRADAHPEDAQIFQMNSTLSTLTSALCNSRRFHPGVALWRSPSGAPLVEIPARSRTPTCARSSPAVSPHARQDQDAHYPRAPPN
jgi:hypothetical protein